MRIQKLLTLMGYCLMSITIAVSSSASAVGADAWAAGSKKASKGSKKGSNTCRTGKKPGECGGKIPKKGLKECMKTCCGKGGKGIVLRPRTMSALGHAVKPGSPNAAGGTQKNIWVCSSKVPAGQAKKRSKASSRASKQSATP